MYEIVYEYFSISKTYVKKFEKLYILQADAV